MHAHTLYFVAVCAFMLVSIPPDRAYSICKKLAPEVHWTSVDGEPEVARDAHIYISFNNPRFLTVKLDGIEFEPVERHMYHAIYAHPSETALGAKTLEITLSDHDEEEFANHPDAEFPDPIMETRTYVLVQEVARPSPQPVSITGMSSIPIYEEDTTCKEIFYDTNCFDTNIHEIVELDLSSTTHPYRLERYVTRHGSDGETTRWESEGLYPAGCTPAVDLTDNASCFRIVTLDDRGHTSVGPERCDLREVARGGSRDSSCSITPTSPTSPAVPLALICMTVLCRRSRREIPSTRTPSA